MREHGLLANGIVYLAGLDGGVPIAIDTADETWAAIDLADFALDEPSVWIDPVSRTASLEPWPQLRPIVERRSSSGSITNSATRRTMKSAAGAAPKAGAYHVANVLREGTSSTRIVPAA